MNIELSTITKLRLTKIDDRLDPISVFVEDIELGKGKITLECFGKSWSYFWGGMSGKTLAEFFSSTDSDYLANCLWDHSKEQYENDYDEVQRQVRYRLISWRRDDMITKETARALYDIETWSDYAPEHNYDTWTCPDNADSDEFDYLALDDLEITLVHTSEYKYLTRIIEAVQIGFTQINKNTSKAA